MGAGSWLGGKRVALVLPAVLLAVNLFESVAAYKVRQHVCGVHARAAIALLLYGVAFVLAADWVTPLLKRALTKTRRESVDQAGIAGLLLFYFAAYGGLFYAYVQCELHGPATLLPRSWR